MHRRTPSKKIQNVWDICDCCHLFHFCHLLPGDMDALICIIPVTFHPWLDLPSTLMLFESSSMPSTSSCAVTAICSIETSPHSYFLGPESNPKESPDILRETSPPLCESHTAIAVLIIILEIAIGLNSLFNNSGDVATALGQQWLKRGYPGTSERVLSIVAPWFLELFSE